MKLSSIVAAALAVCTLSTASAQGTKTESLAIGSKIPAAVGKLKSVSGDMVSLADAKTKEGLLVMFSCNTCPYVVRSQARTKEVMKYAKEKGVGMVIVNSNEAQRDEEDSYQAMVAYAKKQGYNVPYVVDDHSELANLFGASRTPEVYLFDGDGKLIYKGAMEDNPSDPEHSKQIYITQAIDDMLAGKPVDPNSTKSIGCGIKRSL
jgi:peroxiredoxin